MLRTYRLEAGRCRLEAAEAGLEAAPFAAWIDLFEPSHEEEEAVERIVGAEIPTPEEMAEIEASSRIYGSGSAAVMTAPLLIKARVEYPENTDVTFVLTPRHLVTVRYAEPSSFATFAASVQRMPSTCASPQIAFAGLMDAIVDRIADVLEEVGQELDSLSRAVFADGQRRAAHDFKEQMQRVGRNGDTVSKARESLVGLSRVVRFARELDHIQADKASADRLRLVARDVDVLSEHVGFLSNKITFLLDATLGMINIEQNAIIKIFSVVAVVFLPPTLIASIYGMNFTVMPELGWTLGYPFALIAMVISMLVPYLFFKRRGWI